MCWDFQISDISVATPIEIGRQDFGFSWTQSIEKKYIWRIQQRQSLCENGWRELSVHHYAVTKHVDSVLQKTLFVSNEINFQLPLRRAKASLPDWENTVRPLPVWASWPLKWSKCSCSVHSHFVKLTLHFQPSLKRLCVRRSQADSRHQSVDLYLKSNRIQQNNSTIPPQCNNHSQEEQFWLRLKVKASPASLRANNLCHFPNI